MIAGTSTTASATFAVACICIPPWAGGELLKQSPCFRPSQGLHCNHRKCVPWRSRHFHQLFHRQRHAKHGSLRDPVLESDLGHFDPVLDRHGRVEALQDDHRLVNHLRHGSIEQRDHRHAVDNLLHGVSLDPLLRSRHVEQTVWSGATGGRHIIHVHRISTRCLPPEGDASRLRRKVQLEIPFPGPGLLLSA